MLIEKNINKKDSKKEKLVKKLKNLPNKLMQEGIDYVGYGCVPKFAIISPTLNPTQKVLFGILCSMASNKNTCFPSRGLLIRLLNVSPRTYDKALKVLVEEKYIFVKKYRKQGNKYLSNRYIINRNPSKLKTQINLGNHDPESFGFVPRAVVMDERLSIKSRLIYLYICVFAGDEAYACPKKDIMIYHLGMCKETYNRHYADLLKYNYITAKQTREKGRFDVNNYYLNRKPNQAKSLKGKLFDTAVNTVEQTVLQVQESFKKAVSKVKENYTMSLSEAEIKASIIESQGISLSLLSKKSEIYTAVKYISCYEQQKGGDAFQSKQKGAIYNLFIDALSDMLAKASTKIKGVFVNCKQILDKVNQNICIEKKTPVSAGYAELEFSLIDTIIDDFSNALSTYEIKNKLGYMKSCIWNVLEHNHVASKLCF